MVLIFVPSFMKISMKVSEADTIFLLKCSKEHSSVRSVDGLAVLVLCILPDGALYLYRVSRKYLKGF